MTIWVLHANISPLVLLLWKTSNHVFSIWLLDKVNHKFSKLVTSLVHIWHMELHTSNTSIYSNSSPFIFTDSYRMQWSSKLTQCGHNPEACHCHCAFWLLDLILCPNYVSAPAWLAAGTSSSLSLSCLQECPLHHDTPRNTAKTCYQENPAYQ